MTGLLFMRQHNLITLLDVLPAVKANDPSCLQDKLANLVFLSFVLSINILPANDSTTPGATDVCNGVHASNELSFFVFADSDIDKVAVYGLVSLIESI